MKILLWTDKLIGNFLKFSSWFTSESTLVYTCELKTHKKSRITNSLRNALKDNQVGHSSHWLTLKICLHQPPWWGNVVMVTVYKNTWAVVHSSAGQQPWRKEIFRPGRGGLRKRLCNSYRHWTLCWCPQKRMHLENGNSQMAQVGQKHKPVSVISHSSVTVTAIETGSWAVWYSHH